MTRDERRGAGDRGQVGGAEVLPFGFLVFVSVTLLLANAWGIVDARFAVAAAAREATRSFVEAETLPEAVSTADRRARETLASYGRSGDRATIDDAELETAFGRCVRVSITVSYDVPAIAIPFLGGFGSLAPVAATHSELIDPFRSGLEGTATC